MVLAQQEWRHDTSDPSSASLHCSWPAPSPGWAQSAETRPATTTVMGDTGLWFVPTGEVLPAKSGSFSVQRTEMDFRQGNTNVSFWPITGAYGFGRAEIFGSLRMVTRIDRDANPLLFAGPDNEPGGLVNEYPTVHESWSGNKPRRSVPRREVQSDVAAEPAAAGAGHPRHGQGADRR